jgi:hypothetical protein
MDARAEPVAFCLGLLTLVLALAARGASLQRQAEDLAVGNRVLTEEIANLRRVVGDGESLEEQARLEKNLRDRIAAAREIVNRGNLVAHLPAALAASQSGSGWWTSLSIRGTRLVLEGRGPDAEDAAAALDDVRSVPCLGDVSLQSVRREVRAGKTLHSYRVVATVLYIDPERQVPCDIDVEPTAGRDPFLSAEMDQLIRRRSSLPALRRYTLRELHLVRVDSDDTASGGRVLIEDPTGARHPAIVGTVVGDGRARITQIFPDMVLLSEDRIVDQETRAVRTRAFTMALEPRDR